MKVSQICVYDVRNRYQQQAKYCNSPKTELPPKDGIEFRGKFGAWVGGIVGGAATIATAVFAAPVAACFIAGGIVAGAVGGDAAEDAVNGKEEDDD